MNTITATIAEKEGAHWRIIGMCPHGNQAWVIFASNPVAHQEEEV